MLDTINAPDELIESTYHPIKKEVSNACGKLFDLGESSQFCNELSQVLEQVTELQEHLGQIKKQREEYICFQDYEQWTLLDFEQKEKLLLEYLDKKPRYRDLYLSFSRLCNQSSVLGQVVRKRLFDEFYFLFTSNIFHAKGTDLLPVSLDNQSFLTLRCEFQKTPSFMTGRNRIQKKLQRGGFLKFFHIHWNQYEEEFVSWIFKTSQSCEKMYLSLDSKEPLKKEILRSIFHHLPPLSSLTLSVKNWGAFDEEDFKIIFSHLSGLHHLTFVNLDLQALTSLQQDFLCQALRTLGTIKFHKCCFAGVDVGSIEHLFSHNQWKKVSFDDVDLVNLSPMVLKTIFTGIQDVSNVEILFSDLCEGGKEQVGMIGISLAGKKYIDLNNTLTDEMDEEGLSLICDNLRDARVLRLGYMDFASMNDSRLEILVRAFAGLAGLDLRGGCNMKELSMSQWEILSQGFKNLHTLYIKGNEFHNIPHQCRLKVSEILGSIPVVSIGINGRILTHKAFLEFQSEVSEEEYVQGLNQEL